MSASHDDIIRNALRNPQATLDALDKASSERSLLGFVRAFWPVIEPGRKFVEGRMLHVLSEHLEAVAKGQIKKLLINVPPGTAKSTFCSVAFPAWLWGPFGRPDLRVIAWSYAERLAIRDCRKTRMLVDSEKYQRLWPEVQAMKDQSEKSYFELVTRGLRQACGTGGGTTGYRGDILIVDDAHNIKDVESDAKRDSTIQWFAEVLPTRKNDDDTAFVVIGQRTHQGDVSGFILENLPDWDRLILPMEYEEDHPYPSRTKLAFKDWRTQDGELLFPERFDREQVEDLKVTFRSWGGSYAEAGQLQQRPTPREGGMFHESDFVITDEAPPADAERCRGWDLAGTKDKRAAHTVGVLMAVKDGTAWIEDVVRIQGTPSEVESLLLRTAERDGRQVQQSLPQDPGQAGKYQKAALARLLAGYHVRFSPETGSKEDRARPFAAQCEAGNVRMVRANWNKSYLSEVSMFPAGTKRDQVDATSRAYASLVVRKPRRIGAGPTVFLGA